MKNTYEALLFEREYLSELRNEIGYLIARPNYNKLCQNIEDLNQIIEFWEIKKEDIGMLQIEISTWMIRTESTCGLILNDIYNGYAELYCHLSDDFKFLFNFHDYEIETFSNVK